MKRGWKWILVTIIMLAAMIALAGAAAADEPEGQTLPAITVSCEADDGCWIYEDATILIDATDARMLFLTVTNADTGRVILDEALHEDYWAWMGYSDWGYRHESVSWPIRFSEAGNYEITARGYWGDAATPTDLGPATPTNLGPATPTDLPAEDDPGWQETTTTIEVQAEESTPGEATISPNDLEGKTISRGELLSVTVTPAEGVVYCDAMIFATDGAQNEIGKSLFMHSCEAGETFQIPTWEMSGECVLHVISVIPRQPAHVDKVYFTVDGTAPDQVTWALSKNTVDTDETFAVSVYIPGAERVYLDAYQGAYSAYTQSQGATAVLNGIRMPYGPETKAGFVAYDQNWNRYICEETLTINETADAPTPVFVNFPIMMRVGENLTFTLQVDESKITKGPITYDVRFNSYEDPVCTVTSSDGTVTVTVPWSAFEDYQITEPGSSLGIYIRAHGRGYNAQDVQNSFVLGGEQDDHFRIAFSDTEGDHKQIYVNEGFTLDVTLPEDTTGIDYIQIYNNYYWNSYSLSDIPENGIETGHYSVTTTDLPVMARYYTMADGWHYSNVLYVDYISHGPLPAPQASTNLTAGQDGTLSIERWMPLRVTIENCDAYTGKGGPYLMAWIKRDTEEPEREESLASDFGRILTVEGGVWLDFWTDPDIYPEAGDYVLYLQAYDSAYEWDASGTTEIHFTVTQGLEIGEIRFTASDPEVMTGESFTLSAFAPGAEWIEIWRSYSDEYSYVYSTSNYFWTENTYSTTSSEKCTFYAKAYYADREPTISSVVTVQITAPYGDLQSALRCQAPMFIAANEPFSVTLETADSDATEPVIPDYMNVSINDMQWNTVYSVYGNNTNTLVIPAAEDGEPILEDGEKYYISVLANKTGWNYAWFSSLLYAGAEVSDSCELTINGGTEQTLAAGEQYTLTFSGLPEGVTAVGILYPGGQSWSTYPLEEPEATYNMPYIFWQEIPDGAEMYGRFTTDAFSYDIDPENLHWIYTNSVTVTVTCEHHYIPFASLTNYEDATITVKNGRYHQLTGPGREGEICDICGKERNETETTVTLTELHDDRDWDGYCDVCGYRLMGSDDWSMDGNTLTISMDGDIPDYESADETPWAYCRDEVERIILNRSVTGIGDYALAGFTNEKLRIEFLQESQPAISETAFDGIDGAVCRYYTEADWTGGSFGGTGITWIRLPFYRENMYELTMVKYTEDGWVIHDYDTSTNIPVDTVRQAIEITWRARNINLEQTPTAADWTTITDYLNSTLSIDFYPGCSGTLSLTFDDEHPPISLDVAAPGLNLTVTDMSQNENGIGQFVMEGGQVTYNGSIQTLVLRSAFCESPGSSMTVNGDVGEIDFYGSLNTRKYEGSLTVNGQIFNGYEYGNVSMDIPKIETPVTFDDMILAGFSNIQQSEPVILNGALNIDGVTSITGLTYDQFTLNYKLVSDGWYLELKEKAGSETGTLYGAPYVRLADYKADFSVDDIYWSKDTTIHIWNPGEQGSVVLNGPEAGGTEISLIMIEGGNVTVNCDVKELWLQRRYSSDEPCIVTINGRAANCTLKLYRKDGNLLRVGEGGCIANGGVWERMEYDQRIFGAATAGTEVFKDGKLQVMSWRQGQRIRAELPSDNTVTNAAPELGEGVTAMADLYECSEEALDDAERAALNAFLAEQESGMTAAVFDAMILSYSQDEYGTITTYGQITNLDTPVEFKVSNITGGACYIVRLHEENGEMKATQLTEPSSDAVIPFSSDLFSKYAIIARDWAPVAEWNEWELEPVGSYGEYVLHIYGNGAIPDYSSAMQTPWSSAAAGKENIRIVIDEGITGIGSNAFGALEGTVRADFLGSEMPDIDEDAFAGTTAVCRYYSSDSSWTTGTAGRNDARWIRLPYYDENDHVRDVYYNANGWCIEPYTEEGYVKIPVTPEQALEYTHEWRHIHFETLPTETTDMTPVNNWKDVGMLYFGWECEGSMEITLGQDSMLESIDFYAPDANVTINDPRPEGLSRRLVANYGMLNYQGNVHELLLQGSYGQEGDLTIGGDVDILNYFENTSGQAFEGDLTVGGTVKTGIVYGQKRVDVPGIGKVDIGGMTTYTFENVQQTDPIILNSELNLTGENQAKLIPAETPEADQFNYTYQFLESRIFFEMFPKHPAPGQYYSATIENIYDINSDFTTNDVIYGDGTTIVVGSQSENTTYVFNGHTENGEKTGLGNVSVDPACNVVLNCPVRSLWVYHFRYSEGAVNLEINDRVESCVLELNKAPGTVVTLGANGYIASGTWNRTLSGSRYFSNVSGARELFSNGTLNILSRRDGETILALLPSDTAVSAAAGQEATADLSQVTTYELTPAESQKLDEYLATQGSDTVAAVFDVTVTEVITDGDTVTAGNAITELNEAVSLTVSNPTGGNAYVVRLHEDANGEMTAEQISAVTNGSKIPFSSNLFSKYAVVEYKGTATDPETLTKKMILPASLKRIESGAFEGIGAEAVFIPAGCEYIGPGAFVNCGNLVYVEYYEGTEVAADAFEKTTGLVIKVKQR